MQDNDLYCKYLYQQLDGANNSLVKELTQKQINDLKNI